MFPPELLPHHNRLDRGGQGVHAATISLFSSEVRISILVSCASIVIASEYVPRSEPLFLFTHMPEDLAEVLFLALQKIRQVTVHVQDMVGQPREQEFVHVF